MDVGWAVFNGIFFFYYIFFSLPKAFTYRLSVFSVKYIERVKRTKQHTKMR